MITLPKSPNAYSLPIWNQLNNSDVNGTLYASFNLDLTENEGKVRLGKRLVINTNSSDAAEITSYPCGFKVYGANRFAIAGASGVGYVFKGDVNKIYPSAVQFGKVTGSNTPTDVDSLYSDIEVSNGALYVTGKGTSVYKTTDITLGTTWATAISAGTTTCPHMLASFQARTYMTDNGSKIISWDASDTVASSGTYTVDIGNPGSNVITFIRSSSNRIWIGTINTYGGKGYIYEWDGSTTTEVQKSYRLESAGVLSCVIKDDVPYVMDVYGQLLVWNGGTFKKLTALNRIHNKLLYNPSSPNNFGENNKFIHPNGMSIVKGRINLLINGSNIDNTTYINNTIEETIPSGVWEYDEDKGLYHKHSVSLSHVADTIVDYGQVKVNGVGALSELNNPSNDAGRNGTFLAGVSYYTNTTTIKSGIFYDDSNDTLQKAGYFITSKLPAIDINGMPSIQNMYNNIYTMYKSLLDTNDEIVIKYRKKEIDAVIVVATWTSITTFTTTTDLSALVGYEVEPILGVGSGKTSHIVTAPYVAGVCTVTLDKIYAIIVGTSQVRIQNWKKISTINTSSTATYDQAGIGELGNWIQFKIGMIFTGKDEIEKLVVINQNYNSPT